MVSLATGILACVCIALGAYMLGSKLVVVYRANRREKAEARRVRHMQYHVYEAGSQIYGELNDPVTRKAQVRRIAKEVGTVLKEGGVKLAEQFEITEDSADQPQT